MNNRLGRLAALVALGALFLAGCASDAPLDSLDPEGENATNIDNLLQPVLWVALVVFILVFGATIVMWWKFRVKDPSDDEFPKPVAGNTSLEIGWTIVPALILGIIAVPSMALLFDIRDTENLDNDYENLDVVVVGQQWWWEYRYYFDGFDPDVDTYDTPADIVTANQLYLPSDQEIPLFITSRDVIHSFAVPKLNGTMDAVPGLYSPWKLQADEPGVYFGTCREFCGLSHALMRTQAVAVEAADFDVWIEQQMLPYEPSGPGMAEFLAAAREPDAEVIEPATAEIRGAATFRNLCSSCHLIEGVNDDLYEGADLVSGAAPNLTHFSSRSSYAGAIFNLYKADGSPNTNQLEAWIRNPPAEKPGDAENQRGMPDLGLNEEQIDDVVAFLMTTGEEPSDFVKQETVVE
jgi:cytochrome c oxidase subunit 2